jgi:osmotically-inducible protein OsmY
MHGRHVAAALAHGMLIAHLGNRKSNMHAMLVKLLKRAGAAFLTCSLLIACGTSEEEQALAQETKKPLGIGDPKKANAELEQAVRVKLDSDAQIKGLSISVAADVTRNQITLSGTVPSDVLAAKAVDLAKSAQAGVWVSNKLIVK